MSKPPPPAPTASAIGPYPTVIKIVGRPGIDNKEWVLEIMETGIELFPNIYGIDTNY